ncbi:MAG: NADH-quinone oxidoreductase subunit N [Porphyromonadaceae bacterium]|nr:NADH-quinone oxidoreductase subunit N [uncultured Macellibacteroides sp.]MCE5225130.1 NADH-quinone oxidoreductase subunit N [Porphyromonadaceae bacterium]
MDIALLFRFEIIVAILIFALIAGALFDFGLKAKPFVFTMNILLFVTFLIGFLPIPEGYYFSEFFRSSGLIVLQKNIINLGVLLISLTSYNWLIKSDERLEFYVLMLCSVLGVYLMLSSGNVLMLYLGIEMSSIPIAAMSNLNLRERRSSEAGTKLILSSSFSTGIMLFGISLLYGAVGDLSFTHVLANINPDSLTIFAFVLIISGFAFKMSIVPFHLWTADVYEGSPVPVSNFLSVISKGSVVFIFLTVLYTLFGKLQEEWLYAITILSILSMTIGNLFALRQMNAKRFLAFSSIAQVGFVLVGMAGASDVSVTSVVYFILIYMLSNIAAFGVIGAVNDKTGSESLNKFKGLYKSNPFLALMMAIALFSLAGVPPVAGFFAKLFLLAAGFKSGIYVLLAFAGVNLVLSLYNYLRVVKYMFIDETNEPLEKIKPAITLKIALYACLIGLIVFSFAGPFFNYIHSLSI